MDYHKLVQKLFDFFYKKVYKNPNYKLDLELSNHRKVIDSFVKLLSQYYQLPSIDVNFLIAYFVFSFEYWSNKKIKRNVSLNWIVGKKTFQRWLEKRDSSSYYNSKFLKEYDISLDQLKQDLHEEESEAKGLDPAEELEKQRFTGEAIMFNCLLTTTLYNHRSIICLRCEHKVTCKKVLKESYPKIYKNRGYK